MTEEQRQQHTDLHARMSNHTIMSVKQLAQYLDMATVTIYRLAARGELPGVKVGGQWRFHRHAIDHMLQRRRGTPLPPTALEMASVDGMLAEVVDGLEAGDAH